MFVPLLKLAPALRWPTPSTIMNPSQEQLAVNTCISAVQVYFPCTAVAPIDHTCLCEQHTWHVACYDNYASNAISRRDHATAEEYMQHVCLAAGDMGAAAVQRRYHQQRRQINSILNSVGGVVNSFLSSQSIGLAIPTVIPSLPAAPPARTTSQPTSAASSARNSSPAQTTLSPTASPSTSDASQSTSTPAAASSSTSSTISPGVIAGAVIGGVAVLILLGILIMLILRHRHKKRIPPGPTYYPATLEDGSHRSLDETLVDRTPMVEPRVPVGGYVGHEKDVYRSSQQNVVLSQHNVASSRHSEMETNANVWEIDGRERERPMPSELESPTIARGSPWRDSREQRRDPRSELHF